MNKLIIAAVLVLFSASISFGATQSSYATKAAPVGADKALIADSADGNKTKQASLSFALSGDCTGFPCWDGTSDGGTLMKWYGPGGFWQAIQAGNSTANRSWRLPIAAPPPAGTTRLMNMDEYGQMGFVDPATFLTPTGVGGALTVTASGFDGNLATTDDTLQEIAQKVDDLVLGAGGYTNLTSFIAQTAWRIFYSDGSGDVKELALGSDGEYLKSNGAALAPSWSTPSGAAHDAVTLDTETAAIFSLSTQQITLDSQTANYVLAAPNGSAGDPTFRALVATDIPTLNQNTTGTAGGLSGTPNITVGTISAGAAGFAVDADGDVTGKSFAATRTTSAQSVDLYEGTGGGDNKVTIAPSASLSADKSIVAEAILQTTDVDDTPVNGVVDAPVSSNWAYDHAAAADPHTGYVLESALGTGVGTALGIAVNTSGGTLTTAAIDDTPDNSSTITAPSANWAYDHAALSTSDTVVGHIEAATTAETTTGTSASLAVTPDGLSGSVYGQKEIGWSVIASDTVTAVADGKQAAVVPASMNGMNLVDVTCSVHDLNSASSGTTTVVIRRVRGATAVDMTSTGVTIDYNAYTASDETVDTSTDDLATGDKLYVDINAVTSAVQKGLSCTALFQTP